MTKQSFKINMDNSHLMAEAKHAHSWSGVYPAACLPGLAPLSDGPSPKSMMQMQRDFNRHELALIGLGDSKDLAILHRTLSADSNGSSKLADEFFDPDRYLITRTETVNLASGKTTLTDTVVVKTPIRFPRGKRTSDPNIVVVPEDSWNLFSTKGTTTIVYQHMGLAVSLWQLNKGNFTNRGIMELSGNAVAALFGRTAT